jgi:acyl carrier protein
MRKDILKTINTILKENYGFKKKVNINTDLSKIKNWDSLKHLDFIMSLEKYFKIKFSLLESYQIILIKNFITLIKKKIL